MTEPGRILAGRYRLVELLGEGGMGSVWRAEHTELGSSVAVKLIDEELLESTSAQGRFRHEAKAAAALTSVHVVRTFDYGVDQGIPFIAMELLRGESLDGRLKRQGRLSPQEVSSILTQAARALSEAHAAHLVHRDLKPGNLFIVHGDDDHEHVKVLDFGVAKSLRTGPGQMSHTRTGVLVGSPTYMSPEQMRAQGEIDHTTDLWALGVVAYECLLGQRPFRGASMVELTVATCVDPLPTPSKYGEVPPGFDQWFAKACSRHPPVRFQSAKELAQAFEALAAGHDRVPEGAARVSPDDVPTTAGIAPETETVMAQSTAALTHTSPEVAAPREPTRQQLRGALLLAVLAVAVLGAVVVWMAIRASPTAGGETRAADAPVAPTAEASSPPSAAAMPEPSAPPVPDVVPVPSASAETATEKSPATARPAAAPARPRPRTAPRPAPRPAAPKAPAPSRDYGF